MLHLYVFISDMENLNKYLHPLIYIYIYIYIYYLSNFVTDMY